MISVRVFLASALLATTVLAQTSTPTFREAASFRDLLVGAAADADEFGASSDHLLEPDYAATLSSQYNMLEAENAMKWATIHPAQSTYNFEPGDQLVTFAQTNDMKVRGHNLCWNVYNPDWLVNGGFTASQLNGILSDHISAVVTHYARKVFAWDVLNEAVSDSASGVGTDLKDSIWYNQPGIGLTGTGYIEQAFRWAHSADPQALLFYNDYNIEQDTPKFEAVYNMVKDFVTRGVPIDGVGFQMHVQAGGSYPDLSQLASNMQRLAALGIQSHITEMDAEIPAGQFTSTAYLNSQATTYSGVLTVCLQNPGCTAFQTWGFTDKYSWIPGFTNNQYGAALPFDANYTPKPAFTALVTAMQTIAPVISGADVVNAASYVSGGVAPGELITLFQTNYGPTTLVPLILDTDTHVATNLDGVQVFFDGIPAPVIYSVAGQTSVVVPFEVAANASTSLTYRFNSVSTTPVSIPVVTSEPGVFSQNLSGTGPGAIQNYLASSGSVVLNTASNPASPGTLIIVYATGGGLTNPGASDGDIVAGPAQLILPVTATIGGISAPVTYAGAAAGEVAGVMQLNIQVPSGLTSGSQELIIDVGGQSSQHGLTVFIQ